MAHASGRRAAPRQRKTLKSVGRTVVPGFGLLAVVTAAFAAVTQPDSELPVSADAATVLSAAVEEPPTEVSRDAERPPLEAEAEIEAEATGRMYATEKLAVHADNDSDSPELAMIAAGDPVDITGEKTKRWTQVVHNGAARWVVSSGLSDREPLGTAPCARFSERGLQPDGVKVMRAICAKYPQITRIGTIAGRGEHATGRALDIMVSSDLGNDIAAFLQTNRAELGVEYLIWRQRIWRPATSSSWRGMSNRGSATANHMDHVHVTVYGNSGTY